MSNAPSVLMGLVPLIRATVNSGLATTATTVTEDDSGSMFVNLSTTGHTYTLPTVAAGKGKCWIFFHANTTGTFTISGTAIVGYDSAAGTALASPAETGPYAIIIGDGTYYFAMLGGLKAGTWTIA